MLEELLRSDDVLLETGQSVKDTIAELREAGYFAVLVDRAPVFSKETLLHALYQSCMFPAYFGFNWDALEDTLKTDWLEPTQPFKGYVLVFRNFGLLEERDKNVAKTFLDIIREVTGIRQKNSKAIFHIIWAKG
jgi:RNAse (barnase) inhibitor barstar